MLKTYSLRFSFVALLLLLLVAAPAAFAQTPGVGIGTTMPAASAALDVSSSTKGLLPPRLSAPQRDAIASPAAGLTIYNTTTDKLNTWNGTRWDAALSATEQPGLAPAGVSFAYTGGPQTYTVPVGVVSLQVDARGAQGGANGGQGGQVQTTLTVTPGEVLTLYVGGAGGRGPNPGSGGGGYNGGGQGSAFNGAGGGASDVRRSSAALTDRVVVAGGGGGKASSGAGGAGGGQGGTSQGGGGGTATAGGGGWSGWGDGSLGQGGTGQYTGGGGGLYGGGGGADGGGGGGSSYVTGSGSSATTFTVGGQDGNGLITLTPGPAYAAPALDGANFVNVPGDHLGNHTATQNLSLGPHQLVGNGGSQGLDISSTGAVSMAGAANIGGAASIAGAASVGTASPVASAQLEVASTTKGFLPPRLSQPQRDGIASPAPGLTIYNNTTNALNVWNGTAWTESVSAPAPAAPASPVTFAYTGGPQTYTVPAGVLSLLVDAVGGQGGGTSGFPPSGATGLGGRVQATLAVTPGEVLTIEVGGLGGTRATSGGSTPAGYNGGGLGWNASGGGGGATDIRRGGTDLANRILVAGGGGGQGENSPYGRPLGGHGGGLTGTTGQSGPVSARGGTGGSQTAGGTANGTLGLGGEGSNPGPGRYGGAGGGGGYYGGGGGYYGGVNGQGAYGGAGGGGSSWTLPSGAANVVHTQGYGYGNGTLTLTPGGPYAAPALNGSNIVGLSAANLNGPLPLSAVGITPQAGGVLFTTATSFAQNSTQLFWDNTTNRLGLGTAAPAQKLDVAGNALVSGQLGIGTTTPLSTLSLSQVTSQNNTANQTIGELTFVGFNRLLPSAGILAQSPGSDDVSHLILKTSGGGGATERMRITADGNVGIGTTTPAQKLDVTGNTNVTGNTTVLGNTAVLGNSSVSGNLGVGTITPSQKLDVTGNIAATAPLGVLLSGLDRPLITRGYDAFSSGSYSGAGRWGLFMEPGLLTLGIPALSGRQFQWVTYNANSTVAARLMTLSQEGRLGLGTASPLTTLSLSQVTSQTNTPGQVIGEISFVGFNRPVASATIRAESPGYDDVSHLIFKTSAGASGAFERLRITSDGNIGIGTATPGVPLDVQSGVTTNVSGYGFLGSSGTTGFNAGTASVAVSIRASGRVVASEFNAVSDARLKSICGRSDNAADLGLLNRLRITDYVMRDRVQFGDRGYKKVIAQEVEEVLPQAVTRQTGFLPDVYATATQAQALPGDSLLVLTLPAGLPPGGATAGQRLKLIGAVGPVLAVLTRPASAGARTLTVRGAQALASGAVFVYGLEHHDVRAVDYEALSMLNVSATQELARQLEALKARAAAIEAAAAADKAQTTATLESLAQRLRTLEAGSGSYPVGQARK